MASKEYYEDKCEDEYEGYYDDEYDYSFIFRCNSTAGIYEGSYEDSDMDYYDSYMDEFSEDDYLSNETISFKISFDLLLKTNIRLVIYANKQAIIQDNITAV